MGYSSYSYDSRIKRSRAVGYDTKSRDEIFTQSKVRRSHEGMDPKGVQFREACDSETHPNATPVILGLDVTGSMGHIPHQLIKDGLPTLMSTLTQNGVPDTALMFCAVGDHEVDRCPLQVAQFESGDAELDMWLERTYLESGGGGNAGESYLLAWYFAAFHTKTDAWDKRKQKGFLFTVGDEPNLKTLPMSSVKEIMGDTAVGQGTYTAQQLYDLASERYHVFHIHVNHGRAGWRDEEAVNQWKQEIGQHFIEINDHNNLARTISDTIISVLPNSKSVVVNTPSIMIDTEEGEAEVML